MKKITQLIAISLFCFFGTMHAQQTGSFSDSDLSTIATAKATSNQGTASEVIPGQTRAVTSSHTSRAAFQAACSGPGFVVEDFTGGPPPAGLLACDDISSAGSACYPAGEIQPGFVITASLTTSGGVVALGTGFAGNTSDAVGANFFAEFTVITFTDPNVRAAGMDILNVGSTDTEFRVYDAGGILTDTFTLTNPAGSENFFGVITDTPIGRIEIEGAAAAGELVENLEFKQALVVDCSNIFDQTLSCRADLPPVDFNLPIVVSACGNVTLSALTIIPGNSGCPGDEVTITRTYFLQDDAGNMAQCMQTFTVVSNVAPTITCNSPAITEQLDANCEFTLPDYSGTVTATTECGTPTITQSPPAGTVITGAQVTTVTMTVTDSCGRTASCDIDVTTEDVMPPTIVCSMDIMANNDPGVCGANVSFGLPIAFDECGIASVVQTMGLPSGSMFPVGVTNMEFEATDNSGLTSTCSFTVTVVDAEPPTMTCPADITQTNDPGLCGANVTVPMPTVMDNCSTAAAPTVVGPSTSLNFNGSGDLIDTPSTVTGLANSVGGDVTVTIDFIGDFGAGVESFVLEGPDGSTVYNQSGFGGTCVDTSDTFSVAEATWNGWITTFGTDLTFTLQEDLQVDQGQCPIGTDFYQLTVALGAGASLVNDFNGTDDASGFYNVGTTTVNWTFTDVGGNVVMCSMDVTVTDDEAPVIICEGEPFPASDTVSDTPGLPIDTDPGNVVVTSVINIAADETITDMDVDLDISHTWVGDLIITLESPAGTVVDLFTGPTLDCGEVDILATLDDAAATLMDDECNPGQVPTIDGTFMPTSPLAAFNGESTMGNWTLTVTDNFPGLDSGTLNEWGMTYGFLDAATPLDVVLDANGMATVNAADLLISATDNCGPVTATIGSATVGTATPGPMTGSFSGNARGYWFTAPEDMTITGLNVSDAASGGDQNVQVMRFAAPIMAFPGTSNYDALLHYSNSTPGNGFIPVNIPVTAGDIIGILGTRDVTNVNSYSQDTDIDINGTSVPIARFLTQNPIHAVEAPQGSFSTEPASPNVSMVNFTYAVGAVVTSLDFTCDDVGENQVEVTVTDSNGNESMCTATVNVIDDIAPILVCMDFTLELGDDGTAVLDPFDLIDPSSFDACGFAVAAVDIEDFDCSDIGTPVLVTLFVNDPSMNPATCQAIVTVVDLLGPEIVCPLDQSQDPGPGNLFYTVPDYWATGEATATDNCTDPVVITSQDPAPGTLLPDGVYTVTITAEDEYGNVSTCDFELTVESILGLEDSDLNNAIVMYPNPAQNQVTISNSSNILLDSAAIYDVNGKLVSQINLQDMQQEKVIDISSLASGVYIVQIQSEQSSVTKRLIKE